ncbi:MAG: hypothetical protein HKN13_01800 [Rhodothermales bacterium]|nr:hypothetical protein [Rhodothermales bacterium]
MDGLSGFRLNGIAFSLAGVKNFDEIASNRGSGIGGYDEIRHAAQE